MRSSIAFTLVSFVMVVVAAEECNFTSKDLKEAVAKAGFDETKCKVKLDDTIKDMVKTICTKECLDPIIKLNEMVPSCYRVGGVSAKESNRELIEKCAEINASAPTTLAISLMLAVMASVMLLL